MTVIPRFLGERLQRQGYCFVEKRKDFRGTRLGCLWGAPVSLRRLAELAPIGGRERGRRRITHAKADLRNGQIALSDQRPRQQQSLIPDIVENGLAEFLLEVVLQGGGIYADHTSER